MKYDLDADEYHRTIHIRLSQSQYERIRNKAADLRIMDGILQVNIFSISKWFWLFHSDYIFFFNSKDIWEQSRQGTMELVREVLWSWNESLHDLWTSILSNRLLINCLQFAAIAFVYVWAKERGLNVAVIVLAVTAFYVYRYLDAECHRVCIQLHYL